MRETHYVLEDGSTVHPSKVSFNDDGRLACASGLVAMRDDGETPRSRGVDVDDPAEPFGGKGDHDGDGKTGGAKDPDADDEPVDETADEDALDEESAVTEATETPATETTEAKPEPKKPARAKRPGYKTRKAK